MAFEEASREPEHTSSIGGTLQKVIFRDRVHHETWGGGSAVA